MLAEVSGAGPEIVTMLSQLGANLDARLSDGSTWLSNIASRGQAESCRLFLGLGASCDLADSAGRTPLFMASANGHVAVVKLLIQAGGQLDSRVHAFNGVTPLQMACEGKVGLLLFFFV